MRASERKQPLCASHLTLAAANAPAQLDFVNGGYVQHDEAAAHYVAMIDQTTRGHTCVVCERC